MDVALGTGHSHTVFSRACRTHFHRPGGTHSTVYGEQEEVLEEDFSDAAAYWKRKRELKAAGGKRLSDMRRSGGLMPGTSAGCERE
jgi:hypothetical protein